MTDRIRYYSTNRNLKGLPGITPFRELVSFKEALLAGQAPDEGLFMPDRIPSLSLEAVLKLRGAPYADAAMLLAETFLAGEVPKETLRQIVGDSYNFPVPLEAVYERKYIMRLD
ncbi:MAG TPA: threonine synthase, partial [Syntrophales bacterium]|nr:threonine synthase [Syntrophales bacterium]